MRRDAMGSPTAAGCFASFVGFAALLVFLLFVTAAAVRAYRAEWAINHHMHWGDTVVIAPAERPSLRRVLLVLLGDSLRARRP